MKTYDYRWQKDFFNEASMKLDTFSHRQLKKAAEAINTIALDGERESQEYWEQWFAIAIVPVLQEYAAVSNALLEISKDDVGIITATLRHPKGIVVTESCMLRSVLFMCHNILIDTDNGDVVVTMIFDCRKYI